MKISLSVPGRFHAFALAQQLDNNGYLHCLVTSYPVFEVRKYGIPANKIKSIVSKEIIQRFYKKITGRYPESVFLNNWFDYIASYKLPADSDIYIVWAGFGSYTIKRLRRKNPKAIFIVERGSAHIEVQNELLKVFEKGIGPINTAVIKKEEQEYVLADFISVPSLFAKQSFIDKGIAADKLIINYYGVDLSRFKPIATNKNTQQHLFTVGYAGNISNQKNVKGIIEACKILIGKGYKLKLILAGSIDFKSFSEEEITKVSFIDYKGVLPEKELPELYQQMDVFVLNSVQDGFGMVLLQAMAMGVASVATYNTGGPDVIKDGVNGFLIPILDDKALAERIEILINSFEKKKMMGALAMETVRSGFTWTDYGNRAIAFYRDIFKES